MNLKRFCKVLILMFIVICIGTNSSNAAIEIKPGNSFHVNISADTAFEYCKNMGVYTSSLGYNTLDPHLATNADWAASVYLGVSGYGGINRANYSDRGYGYPITLNGQSYSYWSTTNNATGAMLKANDKKFYTAYSFDRSNNWTTKLYNARNTKYVEILSQVSFDNNKNGLAISETKGWFSSYLPESINSEYDYNIPRAGLFSFYSGSTNGIMGFGDDSTTYRPVIWN